MLGFTYHHQALHAEAVPVADIADQVGTPVYMYSAQAIRSQYRELDQAFREVPHLICYAVKANSNLSILHLLAHEGAGADIVSGGELYRALKAGIPPEKIVFSGVGKSDREIREALQAGVNRLHIESRQEFELIRQIATDLRCTVHVAPRINPDIDPQTHPYISTGLHENKFGINAQEAANLFEAARQSDYLEMTGVSVHIGSQITRLAPFVDTVKFLSKFIQERRKAGCRIDSIDIGGGVGIAYNQETPPTPAEYGQALLPLLHPLMCKVVLEPGRLLVGRAGILVTRVLYTKQTATKHFTIVDASITDCIRSALYHAYHEILPVTRQPAASEFETDIVGPVCESGDFFARDRMMPEQRRGQLLAIMGTGAYGFVMASQYNARPRVPEILVYGEHFSVIREREQYDDLIRGEHLILPASSPTA